METLGDPLAAAIEGIQDKTQAPAAICAQAVLATACLAVQGHINVVLPTGQVRPTSCFFLTVAATGERKSAVDDQALWPIRKRERALREAHQGEVTAYQARRQAHEKQRRQILGDKRAYPGIEAKEQALAALGSPPKPPLVPLLTCAEPTLEGLVLHLAVGHPSMGIFSAEGGLFIGGHGLSDEAKLRTAAGLSTIWDGEVITRVRAGDGSMVLAGRRVTIHLQAQPGVAAVMLGDRVLLDQGLLSRILVTAPETAAGTRFWREPDPASDEAIRCYWARLLSILEAPLPLVDGRNELEPRGLMLSPKARGLWIAFSDHVERLIAPGGDLEPVRGLANKLPEHAARIGAVLEAIEDLHAGELGTHAMGAGIEIAQHYAGEALRLFEAGRVSRDLAQAQTLLAWLQTRWKDSYVGLPEIYRLGPNAIREARTARRLAAILEEHGWLIPVEGGAEVGGTWRREVWRVIRNGVG